MTIETQAVPTSPGGGRTRDAVNTRRLLLEAARRRFAHHGYSATGSRDIAADVGVNVALINRYFGSKEGLFEACLERTVEELETADVREPTPEDVLLGLLEQVTLPPEADNRLQLLLLLRSSGESRTDGIRARAMRSYTERIAAVSGWRSEDPGTEHLLLRAQVVMALAFGLVVMRTSAELEPLASASGPQLAAPLDDALRALLAAPRRRDAAAGS